MGKKRTDAERRARQSDRLARVLRVLELIQGPGQWNAQTIARELEVSERTVYRDLQTLTAAAIPCYFDDYAQSYRIREGYRGRLPKIPPGREDPARTSPPTTTPEDDPRSIATLAREAARRLLVEAQGVIQAIDRLSEAIEGIAGPRTRREDSSP